MFFAIHIDYEEEEEEEGKGNTTIRLSFRNINDFRQFGIGHEFARKNTYKNIFRWFRRAVLRIDKRSKSENISQLPHHFDFDRYCFVFAIPLHRHYYKR